MIANDQPKFELRPPLAIAGPVDGETFDQKQAREQNNARQHFER